MMSPSRLTGSNLEWIALRIYRGIELMRCHRSSGFVEDLLDKLNAFFDGQQVMSAAFVAPFK